MNIVNYEPKQNQEKQIHLEKNWTDVVFKYI